MNQVQHIILVDDNQVTNFFNEDLLGFMCRTWKVTTFTSTEAALAYLMQQPPADQDLPTLILLDIKLSGGTGYDLLRELDELELLEANRWKICLLTSSNLVRDQEELGKFPIVGRYIEKPLTEEKVMDALSLFGRVA